jgi:adenylate kinase
MVYKNETLPVAEYYSKQKKVAAVDGMGSIETIFERLSSHIDKKVKA